MLKETKRGRLRIGALGLAIVASVVTGLVAHADTGNWTDPSADQGSKLLDVQTIQASESGTNVVYDIGFGSFTAANLGRLAIQYDFNGDGVIDDCLDVVQTDNANIASGLQGTITDQCSGGTTSETGTLPDAGSGTLIGTAVVTKVSNTMHIVVPLSTLHAAGEVGKSYSFRVGVLDVNSQALRVEDDKAPDAITDFFTHVLAESGLENLSIGSAKKALTSGSSSLKFPVTLSSASSRTVTVHFSTHDGTAVSPKDYTATTGTLTFSPSTTSQTITVPIKHGKVGKHVFTVTLDSPVNAGIASGTGTGTIIDK